MSKIGTIDFTGLSGHVYTFNVYPLKYEFKKEKGAVYVITPRTIKSDGAVEHNILYVGTTNNISTLTESHAASKCLERERANCVCTYWEDNAASRVKINDDLLNQFHPPCNYED